MDDHFDGDHALQEYGHLYFIYNNVGIYKNSHVMSRCAKYFKMLYLNKRYNWDRLCELKILKTRFAKPNV